MNDSRPFLPHELPVELVAERETGNVGTGGGGNSFPSFACTCICADNRFLLRAGTAGGVPRGVKVVLDAEEDGVVGSERVIEYGTESELPAGMEMICVSASSCSWSSSTR